MKTKPASSLTETEQLREWLDSRVQQWNQLSFIEHDPISVPHHYTRQQDIEIAGFFTAIMSWGQRKTIIQNANKLMAIMDGQPYEFILNHEAKERKRLSAFVHRTFQPEDVIYLAELLQTYYQQKESLEDAFTDHLRPGDTDTYHALAGFHDTMFSYPWVLERTRKHISTPVRKSSCKRLNMFLRWMVRKDHTGVDFGLWKKISPSQLVIPLDLHVGRVARHLGLLHRKINDWQAAIELTDRLKQFDPGDPVKYDFALFGEGINKVKSEK